jgi:hypothetical protein
VTAPIHSLHFQSMTGPIMTLKSAPLAADEYMSHECTVDSDGLARYQSQAVWIADGERTLQLRLQRASHTGPGDQCGIRRQSKQ